MVTGTSPSIPDGKTGQITESEGRIGARKKSVTFNDFKLEEVIEFEDDLESKNSRKLFWEFMAVDRVRFKDRIQRMELLLNPVLSQSHRQIIFGTRMVAVSPTYTSP